MTATFAGITANPCPFCGSVETVIASIKNKYFVMCTSCEATGPTDFGKSGAIEQWNEANTEDMV